MHDFAGRKTGGMIARRLAVALIPVVIAIAAPAQAGAAFGYLDQFGTPGSADGQFQDPAGLSAANGELLVADRINLRVQRFNPDTKAFIGKFGTTGGPADVTFDPASGSPNSLLTVDFPNDLIRRFTWNGTPTGLPSTFAATDPDGIAVSTGGTIFVSNTATDQIDRFNSAGTLLGSWGGPGSGNGQFADPSRLTFDLSGNLLVADTGNIRIRRYQSNGTAIDTYGEAGSGNGQFSSPSDVFVPGNGKVYVADELNNRVQILGEGGSPPGVLLPIVTTGAAEGLTRSSARLTGTVNPQGVATDYRFEYGTTTSYGSTTAATAAGSGSADVAAAATITGLTPATTYHYRLVALRGGSVAAVGADRTFTTPDPGTATGCARDGHTIGVVAVCADAITSTGTGTWRASGNVTLNTGVVVGGDLDLDDNQQLITSGAGVSIGVNRGGVVNWGTGRLQIDTNAATDPVSGRTGLAKVTVFDFTRIVQATFGGLTMGFLGTSNEYLDAADGGGLILSVKPNFDLGAFVNVQPVGSFSLGIHATPSSEFRLLGGSIGWNGINLPGGWKIGLLKLEYQSATSAWAFTGGAEITGVGGLEISGGILGGRLDRLGVKVSTPGVPLGQTGIVLDTFGGSISGLANGPLVISALTAGGWTPTGAPQPFNWILHIKDVTLTIDTSGSGTLSGGVAVLDGEGRLASGTISFSIGISPFIASGDRRPGPGRAVLRDLRRQRGDESLPLHRQRHGPGEVRGDQRRQRDGDHLRRRRGRFGPCLLLQLLEHRGRPALGERHELAAGGRPDRRRHRAVPDDLGQRRGEPGGCGGERAPVHRRGQAAAVVRHGACGERAHEVRAHRPGRDAVRAAHEAAGRRHRGVRGRQGQRHRHLGAEARDLAAA